MKLPQLIIIFILLIITLLVSASFITIIFHSSKVVNTSASELSWKNEVPKIYYIQQDGLYSHTLNGSNSKIIFPGKNIKNFFLLDSTKQVVIVTETQLLLIDPEGSNKKVLYEVSDGTALVHDNVSVSPDGDKVAFFIRDTSLRLKLLDIISGKIEEFSSANEISNVPEGKIESLYWFKDNLSFIWRFRFSDSSQSQAISKIILTNTQSRESSLLKEYSSELIAGESNRKADLSSLVDTNNLVFPLRNTGDTLTKVPDKLFNVDSTHYFSVITIGNTTHLSVDSEKLFGWRTTHNGYGSVLKNFNWMPDGNHIIYQENSDGENIKILEVDSKRIALVASIDSNVVLYGWPKWFGEKPNITEPVDW